MKSYLPKYFLAALAFMSFFVPTFQPAVPLSCPGCDLSGQDFSGQDLTNTNFMGARLDHANFDGAILNGANFANASLIGANFQNTQCGTSDWGPVNFQNADLSRTVFIKAGLNAALFEYANLTGADFSDTDLTTSRFGPVLKIDWQDETDRPVFNNVRLGCEFPLSWELLDLEDSDLPDCPGFVNEVTENQTLSEGSGGSISGTTVRDFSPEDRILSDNLMAATEDTVYVSAAANQVNGCGSINNPCRTITAGISACGSLPCAVLVDYGEYAPDSTIVLQPGISLYGGIVKKQQTQYQSLVQAPPDGAPVFSGFNIKSNTTINNFILNGSDAISKGTASVVMHLKQCDSLGLNYVHLNAGRGAPGLAGSAAAAGAAGNAGANGTSSGGGNGGGSNANAAGGQGSKGGTATQHCDCDGYDLCTTCNYSWHLYWSYAGNGGPGSTGYYASGGTSSPGVSYSFGQSKRPAAADAGEAGKDAPTCGVGGKANTNNKGTFSNGIWHTTVGGASGKGHAGGGGGGGGGGGACTYCNGACHGSQYFGTAGGGGGAGGHGAGSAGGGQMGGASLGIVLINVTLQVDNRTMITNYSGGAGGAGGAGNRGGVGGAGGAPKAAGKVCDETGGQGARGGNGGYGSASGGGAGGNGGPSLGIALVGTSKIVGGLVYYQGISGKVGEAGPGGAAAKSGLCTGAAGAAGQPGKVANTHQF